MTRTLAGIFIAVLLSGCGPWVNTPGNPSPSKPTVETIWTCIADSIDAGEIPQNSTQFILMLTHLRTLQKITDSEVAAAKACVPEIDTKETPLTKVQSDAIRGLK